MAFPIIVVKENPETLVIEVRRDNEDGKKPETIASLRLPSLGRFVIEETQAKVGQNVHVDPHQTSGDGKHYRVELRKKSGGEKVRRRPSKKKGRRRG